MKTVENKQAAIFQHDLPLEIGRTSPSKSISDLGEKYDCIIQLPTSLRVSSILSIIIHVQAHAYLYKVKGGLENKATCVHMGFAQIYINSSQLKM